MILAILYICVVSGFPCHPKLLSLYILRGITLSVKYFGHRLYLWSHTLGGICYTTEWPPHQLIGERHDDWSKDHNRRPWLHTNVGCTLKTCFIKLVTKPKGALVTLVTQVVRPRVALGKFQSEKEGKWERVRKQGKFIAFALVNSMRNLATLNWLLYKKWEGHCERD